MNVRCPSCQSTFRVDPDKIPAAGVRARCSRCGTAFQLQRQNATEPAGAMSSAGVSATRAGGAAAAAPPPPRPVSGPPAQPATRPSTYTPAPPQPMRPMAPAAAAPVAASAVAAQATAPASTSAAGAPAAPPAGKRPSFRNQDPGARAQRIARALVSDIVAYNKSKLQGPVDGTKLRTEFREEIRKSWEEYVEQVGLEMARSTPYFRDSLNEILARGQKVF